MKENIWKYRKILYMIVYVITVIIVVQKKLPSNLSVEIMYGNETSETTASQIYFDIGNDFNEEDSVWNSVDNSTTKSWYVYDKVNLNIPEKYFFTNRLRIDFPRTNDKIELRCITFKNMGVTIIKIPAEIIEQYFELFNIESINIQSGYMTFVSNNENPYIIANGQFIDLYNNLINDQKEIKINIIFLITILFCCLNIIDKNYKKIKECIIKLYLWIKKNKKNIDKLMSACVVIGGLFSFVLVCIMAFGSRDYAHPDENLTKAAIDYYLGKWFPPDIRNSSLIDSFSTYGNTRLRESTVYYLLAGKIGFLAQFLLNISCYYRIFNVMLFGVIVGIVIKERKNMPYLFIAIGISPQIWYIFSYATSDAFDYTIAFLVIYVLLKENSFLNKFITCKTLKGNWKYLLFSGLLFANVFMSKENYYIMLIVAFIILMFNACSKKREQFLKYIKRYIMIVVMCTLLLLIRYSLDAFTYEDGKDQAISEMVQKYSKYENNLNGENDKYFTGVDLENNGISLKDIIVEFDFFEQLFGSTIGKYGWMEYASGTKYIKMMSLIYFLIIFVLWYYFIKTRDKYIILEKLLLNLAALLIICIVLWNCWTNDFQAQGRYILTIFLIVSYCFSSILKEKRKIILDILIILANIFSLYSFYVFGITNLI